MGKSVEDVVRDNYWRKRDQIDEQERNGQQAFLYDWYWCFYHCQDLSIDALLKVKKKKKRF